MSKVASRSITDSLCERADLSVIHVHFINSETIDYINRRLFGEHEVRLYSNDPAIYGRLLYERLIKLGHRAFIITLVREPIAHNISSYFHILNLIWQQPDALLKIPFDQLVEGFLSKHMLAAPIEWFDREFKPTLGIDIYSYP